MNEFSITSVAAMFIVPALVAFAVSVLFDALKRRNGKDNEHQGGGSESKPVHDRLGFITGDDVEQEQEFCGCCARCGQCAERAEAFDGEVHGEVEHGDYLCERYYSFRCHGPHSMGRPD